MKPCLAVVDMEESRPQPWPVGPTCRRHPQRKSTPRECHGFWSTHPALNPITENRRAVSFWGELATGIRVTTALSGGSRKCGWAPFLVAKQELFFYFGKQNYIIARLKYIYIYIKEFIVLGRSISRFQLPEILIFC